MTSTNNRIISVSVDRQAILNLINDAISNSTQLSSIYITINTLLKVLGHEAIANIIVELILNSGLNEALIKRINSSINIETKQDYLNLAAETFVDEIDYDNYCYNQFEAFEDARLSKLNCLFSYDDDIGDIVSPCFEDFLAKKKIAA